jgi:hypothetical protein
VLDTTFNSVDLVSQKWPTENPTTNVYGIFFMGVQIQLLNNNLIPGTSNFVLFADPAQGNLSNIGWLMTYVKKS